MVDDDRFDKFKRDPRFKSVKHKKGTRVKVDKRFGAMFKAKSEFNQHLVRDRYGQKKNLSKQERAQILRFYENEEEGEKGKQNINLEILEFYDLIRIRSSPWHRRQREFRIRARLRIGPIR